MEGLTTGLRCMGMKRMAWLLLPVLVACTATAASAPHRTPERVSVTEQTASPAPTPIADGFDEREEELIAAD